MARIRAVSLNVENLFERRRAMSGQMHENGNPILAAHQARIDELFAASTYADEIGHQILDLLEKLACFGPTRRGTRCCTRCGRLVKRPAAPVWVWRFAVFTTPLLS